MALSVFDLFSIGIGPSSSHTVGPMRAAVMFATGLEDDGLLESTVSVKAELFGSLGATGHGHGSDKAVILGLLGEHPETVEPDDVAERVAAVRQTHRLLLLGRHEVAFDPAEDLVMHRRRSLPFHPNGMQLSALDAEGGVLRWRTYYSVGGFVVDEAAAGDRRWSSVPTLDVARHARIVPRLAPQPVRFAAGRAIALQGSQLSRTTFADGRICRE